MINTILKYTLICLYFSTLHVYSQDTIPFTLGNDNRIYIKATVNDSEPLDFIFDTGANAMVVNTTKTDSKLNLKFDSNTQNTGANGTINQIVSTGNSLSVGKFLRENEEFLGIPYPEKYYSFDGVIGYNFFEDYFIEINYRLEKLILHKSKKTILNLKSYRKERMQMISGVPFVDITIYKGDKPVIFPAMIDTGYNGELIIYNKVVLKDELSNYYKKIDDSESEGTDGTIIKSDQVIIPRIILGKDNINSVISNLNLTPTPTPFPSIMGGELLKKRDWILNFKTKHVYIKTPE